MMKLNESLKFLWYIIINILIFLSYFSVKGGQYFLTFVLMQLFLNSLIIFLLYQLGGCLVVLEHALKYNRFRFYTHQLNETEIKLVKDYNYSQEIQHVNSFLEGRLVSDKSEIHELNAYEKVKLLNLIYYISTK